MAALHVLLGHLWDADVVQVLDYFYAFQIPPHVCPDKMDANKNTVQAVSYTVSLEDGTENTPRRNKQTCQKGEKQVYLFQRCGVIRCVGGLITCAGTGERQLPCTAVIFVSACIILPNKCSVNCNMKKCANVLIKTEKFITL